jgi:hypothetical protein
MTRYKIELIRKSFLNSKKTEISRLEYYIFRSESEVVDKIIEEFYKSIDTIGVERESIRVLGAYDYK